MEGGDQQQNLRNVAAWRTLSSFDEEQVKYLEKLVKFSGRNSKVENVKIKDKASHKEIVVKEYFNYLKVDEQVSWNDLKARFAAGQKRVMFLTGFSFLAGCGYFVMTTPVTKSLGLQAVKSGIGSLICGFAYYKYEQAIYRKQLHSFYILTSDRIKDRRRRELDSLMN